MELQKVPFQSIVFVCTNSRPDGRISCANPGRPGVEIREKLKAEIKARGLKGRVRVCSSGCMDLCEQGPNVMLFTESGERVWYKNVAESDLPQILENHFPPKTAPAGE